MNPARIFLVPARPGLRVPMPERRGSIMPAEGAWVLDTTHWARRLADGDVKAGTPPAPKTAAPASAPDVKAKPKA